MEKYQTPTYEKLEVAGKNNFFVRLCYGYVEHTLGMNTEEMTTREVIQEFLDSKGLKSPREFFDRAFKKTNTQNPPRKSTAKTRVEAEQIVKNCARTVNYNGVTNVENLNKVNDVVIKMFKKYSLTNLDTIKSANYTKASARACFSSLGISRTALNQGLKKIDWTRRKQENVELMKNPLCKQKLRKKLENENKYNRWSVSDSGDIQDAVTHEFGHIIADQYIGQINGRYANPNYKNDPTNACRIACDKIELAFGKAKKNGDIYNISMYASTNSHEFFAESFCMYEKGEALPNYINKMIEEILNNGKL